MPHPPLSHLRGGSFSSSCSQLSSSCESLLAISQQQQHQSRTNLYQSNKTDMNPPLSWTRHPTTSSASLLRRRPSWIAAQSWSSGLDRRPPPEPGELEAFGGGGGADGRSSVYGSAISLILGAGLIGASKENEGKGEEEEKEEEEEERLTPKSKRRRKRKEAEKEKGALLCRGIRLETVDAAEGEEKRDKEEWPIMKRDDDEEEEKDPEAWDGSVISVWKVGEREDVTEAEAREDGEHIICRVEKCSNNNNGKEEEKEGKFENKRRKRKCEVKAEEEKEEEEEKEMGQKEEEVKKDREAKKGGDRSEETLFRSPPPFHRCLGSWERDPPLNSFSTDESETRPLPPFPPRASPFTFFPLSISFSADAWEMGGSRLFLSLSAGGGGEKRDL